MSETSSRLARRLGTTDAVVIGLSSMVGAGVFVAIGPAAEAAGSALLVGLALAGAVAYCNATSSAQLAARYPESGGTYVYGRERLGPVWGYLAGWGFVVGKTASCAAVALTFGSYVAPDHARALAIGVVACLTAINLAGVRKTAIASRVILALVLVALAVVVAAGTEHGLGADDLGPAIGGWHGVLQAAGLLFFAFAGYARIATLGEEVRDPARTIPRAIPIALGVALGVYAVVAVVALASIGAAALARSAAPLEAVARASSWSWAPAVTRAGAAVATVGVLLSLLAGVSRTAFAMGANRDLPRWLGAVHPARKVPHRAELAVGAVVVVVLLVTDVRGAIGFSSFAVLTYYAVANASAWTLEPGERRWPRWLAGAGLVGCVALALSLPAASVVVGAAVLVVGLLIWWPTGRRLDP
ncbi:APC family permease [Dermatobacter hominis]|uniref:APC family permease n=1 Tax=Dermatobacter hominis TaxID=2884263 RepID=UPI001D1119CE|nr:APC family permease [Dermatobacter hominis]UDY37058.1 APC family permease [Dermatobacter hominis]